MATKTTNELLWSRGNVFMGPAGSVPSTPVGYVAREGGTELTLSKEVVDYMVDDLDGPALSQTISRGVSIKCNLAQVSAETLAYALGVTASGETITLGGSGSADTLYAIKVTATRKDGRIITWQCLQGLPVGEVVIALNRDKASELPLEIRALDDATNGMMSIDLSGTGTVVELASGVLTRQAGLGYHQVGGEGDAPDSLTSVAGASLADGEILRLQIASTGQPITLVHLADTLELDGDADWVMTRLNDYIDLQYNLAGTKWVEIGRYNAVA